MEDWGEPGEAGGEERKEGEGREGVVMREEGDGERVSQEGESM